MQFFDKRVLNILFHRVHKLDFLLLWYKDVDSVFRCTSLVLSVHHLVLVTKAACHLSGVMDWIDQSLAEVEQHLKVLQLSLRQFTPKILS